jgi:hypothetical protein
MEIINGAKMTEGQEKEFWQRVWIALDELKDNIELGRKLEEARAKKMKINHRPARLSLG